MENIFISGKEYVFEDNGQNFIFTLSGKEDSGIVTLRVRMDFRKKIQPQKVSMRFTQAALGADGVWTACGGLNRMLKPDWKPFTINARSVTEYPVLAVVSFDDTNVCTLSVKDSEKPCSIKAGYREEGSVLVYEVEWFFDVVEEMESYETELSIDFRPVHFAKTVGVIQEWFARQYDLKPAPEAAFKPAFSTWYCFHQKVYREKLLAECREARKLGLETVILDDGWQTEDNSRGYGYSGDYLPAKAKVGDIRTLTEEIHAIGMKSMLWFSLAFSGDFAKGTEKFGNMSLYHSDDLKAYVVDPRFKEVREHIVCYCSEAVREWGFDGLKLDFIDSFYLTKESAVRHGTDCASIEEGIKRLFDELSIALRKIKQDVLVEFRQSYIGPAMQRLGNMLRVGDCPGSLVQNRVSLIDLRLIAGERAVHADPVEWHTEESAQNIARYLINCVFATLQYSAYPSELTETQRKVSRKYISFMRKYEDVLLHGDLIPHGVLCNYISCEACKGDDAVIAVYADVISNIVKKNTVVLNGGMEDRVLVDTKEKRYAYTIEDCTGEEIEHGKISGTCSLNVPIGGFAYLCETSDIS